MFNLSKEEVANYFYWRQLDATRNSILMVGQANFSCSELQNKTCEDIKDMLMAKKGIIWNNLPAYQKHGSCCIKREFWVDKNTGCEFNDKYQDILNENAVKKKEWIIDKEIPVFKNINRYYIEKYI